MVCVSLVMVCASLVMVCVSLVMVCASIVMVCASLVMVCVSLVMVCVSLVMVCASLVMVCASLVMVCVSLLMICASCSGSLVHFIWASSFPDGFHTVPHLLRCSCWRYSKNMGQMSPSSFQYLCSHWLCICSCKDKHSKHNHIDKPEQIKTSKVGLERRDMRSSP